MNCLRIDQIYLYLEKDLSAGQRKKFEAHLASCLKCKERVEERRLLLQAAESLPAFEVPANFTQQIMAKIFPAKVPLFGWLLALAACLSSIILTVFVFLLTADQDLPSLLLNFNHTVWNYVKNTTLILGKLLKLLSLSFKILWQFSGELLKGFGRLGTIISPEIQIIITSVTLILVISLIYSIRRKFEMGEKS